MIWTGSWPVGNRIVADFELTVDTDGCEANAVCVGIAPELFALDDEDRLQIADSHPQHDMLERARQAVAGCPKRALLLRQLPGWQFGESGRLR